MINIFVLSVTIGSLALAVIRIYVGDERFCKPLMYSNLYLLSAMYDVDISKKHVLSHLY